MLPKLSELAQAFAVPFALFAIGAFEVLAYTWPIWSWGVIVWLLIRIGKKLDRRA
jgi:hypothetical protein